MKREDYQQFATYLSGVMTLYRQETTEFTVRMWWRLCQRFTLAQFMQAMDAHVADAEQGRFAPMPAHIVKLLLGTHAEQAQLAWGKLYGAMVHVGAWQNVCFDDALIHRVVEDMGGWPRMCASKTTELGFLQTQFCKSYQAYALRQTAREVVHYVPVLTGLRDADDADDAYERYGLNVPGAVLVGDSLKCQAVMLAAGGFQKGDDQQANVEQLVNEQLINEKFVKAV